MVRVMGKMRAENCGLAKYEIHVINAQDGCAYAGLKCHSKKNVKTYSGAL